MARTISAIKGASSDSESKPITEPKSVNTREQSVNGLFQIAQMGLVTAGQYADAVAIGLHGEKISHEIVQIANTNARIARAVDYLTEVGPYAGLVTAVLPFVMQLAANHRMIPANKLPGVIDPQVLQIQMETEITKQAILEMEKAQQVKAEYEAMMTEVREATERAESNGDGTE